MLAFGNRENSSLTNIKTALEMDSNEEKVFKMNQMAQEKQAKELASKRAKEIDQERVARAKSNLMGFGSNSDKRDSFGSAPSDFSRMTVNLTCTTFPRFLPPPVIISQVEREPVAAFEAPRPKVAALKKGATLTLGSKKKDSMTMQALREEGELAAPLTYTSSPSSRRRTSRNSCRHAPSAARGSAADSPRAAELDVSQVRLFASPLLSSLGSKFGANARNRATYTWRLSRSSASSGPPPPFSSTIFQSHFLQILAGRWH